MGRKLSGKNSAMSKENIYICNVCRYVFTFEPEKTKSYG